MKIYVR